MFFSAKISLNSSVTMDRSHEAHINIRVIINTLFDQFHPQMSFFVHNTKIFSLWSETRKETRKYQLNKDTDGSFKGAVCSFRDEMLMSRERSSLADKQPVFVVMTE